MLEPIQELTKIANILAETDKLDYYIAINRTESLA
jgi:hypothetical protein